jgi:hypothetical protein
LGQRRRNPYNEDPSSHPQPSSKTLVGYVSLAVTSLASLLSFVLVVVFLFQVEALWLGIPSVTSALGFAYVSVRPPTGLKLLLVVVVGLLAIVLLISLMILWNIPTLLPTLLQGGD